MKVRGNLLFGPLQIVECDPTREHFCYNSWHCSAYERKLCDKGLCSYIPMIFRNVVPYYRHFLTVNVAMMCVPPYGPARLFQPLLRHGVLPAASWTRRTS